MKTSMADMVTPSCQAESCTNQVAGKSSAAAPAELADQDRLAADAV